MFYIYHIRPSKWAGFYSKGYIGITEDFKRRRHEHFSKMKLGEHKNYNLNEAYQKFGRDLDMVIINQCLSREEVSAAEKALRPLQGMSWNLKSGGEGISIEQLSLLEGEKVDSTVLKNRFWERILRTIGAVIVWIAGFAFLARSLESTWVGLIIIVCFLGLKPLVKEVWDSVK